MGTDVRTPPERIAAVSVGVLWGRRHKEQRPEMLPVTDVGIAIVDCAGGQPVVERHTVLEGGDLKIAPDHLLDLGVPIVAYNALRFDWVALGALTDVDALIPRTIDIYSALYPCAKDIVDAEGVAAFPVRGDYGVLHPHRVAETNLGFVPGGSDDSSGDAELAAALWHHFVSYERAIVAGRTQPIEDRELAILHGETPAIASAEAWRELLAERPEPKPYKRRDRNQITFPRIDQRYV